MPYQGRKPRNKIVHEWPPVGTMLKGRTKGKDVYAKITLGKTKRGKVIEFENTVYESMSGAAQAATGYYVDGWIFWKAFDKE